MGVRIANVQKSQNKKVGLSLKPRAQLQFGFSKKKDGKKEKKNKQENRVGLMGQAQSRPDPVQHFLNYTKRCVLFLPPQFQNSEKLQNQTENVKTRRTMPSPRDRIGYGSNVKSKIDTQQEATNKNNNNLTETY